MKYRQLYAELIAAGCYVVRNGGNHDMWFSPITGNTLANTKTWQSRGA